VKVQYYRPKRELGASSRSGAWMGVLGAPRREVKDTGKKRKKRVSD